MIKQITSAINMPLFDGADSKNDSALVSLGMLTKEKLAFDSNKLLLKTLNQHIENQVKAYVTHIAVEHQTQDYEYDN